MIFFASPSKIQSITPSSLAKIIALWHAKASIVIAEHEIFILWARAPWTRLKASRITAPRPITPSVGKHAPSKFILHWGAMGGIHLTALAKIVDAQIWDFWVAQKSWRWEFAHLLISIISTIFSPYWSEFLFLQINHKIIANKLVSKCSFNMKIIPNKFTKLSN